MTRLRGTGLSLDAGALVAPGARHDLADISELTLVRHGQGVDLVLWAAPALCLLAGIMPWLVARVGFSSGAAIGLFAVTVGTLAVALLMNRPHLAVIVRTAERRFSYPVRDPAAAAEAFVFEALLRAGLAPRSRPGDYEGELRRIAAYRASQSASGSEQIKSLPRT